MNNIHFNSDNERVDFTDVENNKNIIIESKAKKFKNKNKKNKKVLNLKIINFV